MTGLLIKQGSALLGLHLINATLGAAAAALILRLAGTDGYGAYQFALSLVGILVVPALRGLPSVSVRTIAGLQVHREWGRIWGYVRFSQATAGATALVLALAVAATGALLAHWTAWDKSLALVWAAPALPLAVVISLSCAFQQGIGNPVLAHVPVSLVRAPLLCILLLAWPRLAAVSLSSNRALALNAFAALAGATVALALLLLTHRRAPAKGPSRAERRDHLASGKTIACMDLAFVVMSNTPILVVGAYLDKEQTGIFAIGWLFANCIGLILVTANAVIGPRIVQLVAKPSHLELQSLLSGAAILSAVPATAVFVMLFWLGRPLLSLLNVYDPETHVVVLWMCAGQIINILFGSGGLLLVMSGWERQAALSVVLAAAFQLVVSLALVPLFGIMGAVAASIASTSLWNLLVVHFSQRRCSVNPTALGVFLQYLRMRSR